MNAKNTKGKNTQRKKDLPLIITTLLVVALTAGITVIRSRGNGGKTAELKAGEYLSIPVSAVTETASFYPVTVDGTEMEVLAIRTAAGEIRTAFNTCQSCYTSGNGRYEANGTELICQNCGFHFTAEQVGLEGRGGCNPWPITADEREESDGSIRISYEFLSDSRNIFARWSRQ